MIIKLVLSHCVSNTNSLKKVQKKKQAKKFSDKWIQSSSKKECKLLASKTWIIRNGSLTVIAPLLWVCQGRIWVQCTKPLAFQEEASKNSRRRRRKEATSSANRMLRRPEDGKFCFSIFSLARLLAGSICQFPFFLNASRPFFGLFLVDPVEKIIVFACRSGASRTLTRKVFLLPLFIFFLAWPKVSIEPIERGWSSFSSGLGSKGEEFFHYDDDSYWLGKHQAKRKRIHARSPA